MRATFDLGVPLRTPGGESASLEPTYAIAETKTSADDGASDSAFADVGLALVSLSKYRLGTGLLHTPDADTDYTPHLKERFQVRAASLERWRRPAAAARSSASSSCRGSPTGSIAAKRPTSGRATSSSAKTARRCGCARWLAAGGGAFSVAGPP
jgi:hypothetical protein